MNFKLSVLICKIGEVIFNTKSFWNSQKSKEEGFPVLIGNYFFPILLTVILAVFLGEFFRGEDFYVVFAVLKAVRKFILFTLAFLASVYFTNTLVKSFNGKKDIKLTRQIVSYSFTPILLVSVVTGLFPFLYPLEILGMYSFYIFWVGGKKLLTLPEQKRDSYLILTIVVNFVIFWLLSLFLTQLLTVYF